MGKNFRYRTILTCFLIFIYPVISFNIFPIVDLETHALPRGATFDTRTGVFTWTPDNMQAGIYTLKFKVTDSNGGIDEEIINITVIDTH